MSPNQSSQIQIELIMPQSNITDTYVRPWVGVVANRVEPKMGMAITTMDNRMVGNSKLMEALIDDDN